MSMPVAPHEEKVAAIAAQVRAQAQDGQSIHVVKGGVSHVVPLPDDPRFRTRPVDISPLDQILDIDPVARRCVAEPGVTFARVVEATLAHGLIPTVVPELEGITIGGAVAGCSVEAMSYRYGGFHDSCLEYEVVTGAGEVLTLSPQQEPLMFGMIHGSYGTLGILTRLTFRLVPAKPFVRVEYRRFATVERFEAELLARCRAADFDFIDGIIHGPDEHILCLGQFVDTAPFVSDYRWLNIYYKSTRERTVDYLATADYCFRYDTECHWLTRSVPPLEWKPVRLAVGKLFLGSTNLIRWSKRLEKVLKLKRRPDVVCDVFIPQPSFVEFFRWYDRTFDFYPLWVVPYRIPAMYPWVADEQAKRLETEYIIDCAVYGKPNGERDVDYSRLLEDKTYELGGIKTLISRNHYSPDRFWRIYHREHYTAAKARLDPQGAFANLFDQFRQVE
ncbi:MAG TPA: FAD-binding oxidoreductase [Polyangia bacterium]|jgi:FAD/FMN-containing dehydrogenase